MGLRGVLKRQARSVTRILHEGYASSQAHLDNSIAILGIFSDTRKKLVQGAKTIGSDGLVTIFQLADEGVENVNRTSILGKVGGVCADTIASA